MLLGYDLKVYVPIKFISVLDIFDSGLSVWGILVYLEQLWFGNKRLPFYANVCMGLVLFIFPISQSWSWYFLAQIPVEFILEFIWYPLFP